MTQQPRAHAIRSSANVQIAGKKLLLRLDLNCPLSSVDNTADQQKSQSGERKVTDNSRITAIVDQLIRLSQSAEQIFIVSHLGRPNGKVEPSLSLLPIYHELRRLLAEQAPSVAQRLHFAPTNWLASDFHARVQSYGAGDIVMFENLRFTPHEEANDTTFAQMLASIVDIYINDAFSASHRSHASVVGVTKFLPSFGGETLVHEISQLQRLAHNARAPVTAIIAGAKISSKIPIIRSLMPKVDCLIIGGAMANNFLWHSHGDLGSSLIEHKYLDLAKELHAQATALGVKLLLPVDGIVSPSMEANSPARTSNMTDLTAQEMLLDIGPATIELYRAAISTSASLIWNGPLGLFENPTFSHGTISIAQAVAGYCETNDLQAVAGGGDTVAALRLAGVMSQLTYVSLAGGAFLEWFEGKTLPGLAALALARA